MTLTLRQLRRAEVRANDLRLVRDSIDLLRQQTTLVVTVQVPELRRTYGIDRVTASWSMSRQRVLDILAEEEAAIVAELAEIGVDASRETKP